jgi:hypothetical protein
MKQSVKISVTEVSSEHRFLFDGKEQINLRCFCNKYKMVYPDREDDLENPGEGKARTYSIMDLGGSMRYVKQSGVKGTKWFFTDKKSYYLWYDDYKDQKYVLPEKVADHIVNDIGEQLYRHIISYLSPCVSKSSYTLTNLHVTKLDSHGPYYGHRKPCETMKENRRGVMQETKSGQLEVPHGYKWKPKGSHIIPEIAPSMGLEECSFKIMKHFGFSDPILSNILVLNSKPVTANHYNKIKKTDRQIKRGEMCKMFYIMTKVKEILGHKVCWAITKHPFFDELAKKIAAEESEAHDIVKDEVPDLTDRDQVPMVRDIIDHFAGVRDNKILEKVIPDFTPRVSDPYAAAKKYAGKVIQLPREKTIYQKLVRMPGSVKDYERRSQIAAYIRGKKFKVNKCSYLVFDDSIKKCSRLFTKFELDLIHRTRWMHHIDIPKHLWRAMEKPFVRKIPHVYRKKVEELERIQQDRDKHKEKLKLVFPYIINYESVKNPVEGLGDIFNQNSEGDY